MRDSDDRNDWGVRGRLIGRAGRRAATCTGAAVLVGVALVLYACQAPTDAGIFGSGEPAPFDSLSITGAPSTVLIREKVTLSAKLWRGGATVSADSIAWRTLDPLIAGVSADGLVTGSRRGTARIVASTEGLADTVTLRLSTQLRIERGVSLNLPGGVPMAVDDRLQLGALSVDAAGAPIPDVPVTWASSNPALASVDASGLVSSHVANSAVLVTAATVDDTLSVAIKVLDFPAGQPASVRIAHGIPGVGPVRFRLSQGSEVSLEFGQSVEVPVVSGTLRVATVGMPSGGAAFGDGSDEFLGVIRPGDALSLYAVGTTGSAGLQALWPTTADVEPDSILVRVVQSSRVLVVYLRDHGEPRSGLPELCYFDPGTVSPYFARAAGDFDVIGQEKYDQMHEIGRASASVPAGHAVTMVLTGGDTRPLGIMTFVDR